MAAELGAPDGPISALGAWAGSLSSVSFLGLSENGALADPSLNMCRDFLSCGPRVYQGMANVRLLNECPDFQKS